MNQGSNAWVEWRRLGIGSSDAPVIMKESPYKTPNQLFREKTGLGETQTGNEFIFEKGHKTEMQARSWIEIQYGGIEFQPGLCQMIDYPFLRASLDGANFEYGLGLEFKLVSKAEFDKGVCPPRYYAQIQHQYMVSGLPRINIVLCCYVGKLKQLKTKEVEVPCDLEYIHKMARAELEFWWKVQNNIPPELIRGDAVIIKDKKIIAAIRKYTSNQKRIAEMEHENRELNQTIADGLTHPLMSWQNKLLFKPVKAVRIECI
jgi:putative phage-type endonuclease